MDQAINSAVINNPNLGRYELAVEGHVAAAYYHRSNGVFTFDHIGSKLVKGALDQVRADGLKVVAECPFVKGWIEKHPDYRDLLKV